MSSLAVQLEATEHGDLSLTWYSKALTVLRSSSSTIRHSDKLATEKHARLLKAFQTAYADARRLHSSTRQLNDLQSPQNGTNTASLLQLSYVPNSSNKYVIACMRICLGIFVLRSGSLTYLI